MCIEPEARERPAALVVGVSRFGAIPKPTVTVRMEENGTLDGPRTMLACSIASPDWPGDGFRMP